MFKTTQIYLELQILCRTADVKKPRQVETDKEQVNSG